MHRTIGQRVGKRDADLETASASTESGTDQIGCFLRRGKAGGQKREDERTIAPPAGGCKRFAKPGSEFRHADLSSKLLYQRRRESDYVEAKVSD